MTAWQRLAALSSLLTGTAWQRLTNPKTTGTGLVVNDGIDVEMDAMTFEIDLEDQAAAVEVAADEIATELNDETITVEVEEW